MAFGYLLLFGAMFGYSLLGIFHKVADRPDCRPNVIAGMLLFWAALLVTCYTLLFTDAAFHVPPKVALIGAGGGVFASLALLAFQTALRYGKISTSWLLISLSVSVPIVLSLVVYGEHLNFMKAVGVGLVFVAIVLLWLDKRSEQERSDLPADDATHANPVAKAKWLPLMIVAFVANGLAGSSIKVLGESFPGRDFSWQFTAFLYWGGFALMVILSPWRERLPNRRELGTALVMAVASVAGNVLLAKALGCGVTGSVAYPVANGGSLFVVVAAGLLLFKERLTRWGVVGVGLGIVAIVTVTLA